MLYICNGVANQHCSFLTVKFITEHIITYYTYISTTWLAGWLVGWLADNNI